VVDKCLCIFFNFFGVTSLSQLLLSYFESPPSGDKALIKLRRYYQEKKIEEGSKSFGDTTDTFIELLSSKIIEEIRNPNTAEKDSLLKIQKHWPELFDTIQAKLHCPSSSLEENGLQFIPSIVQDAQTDEEYDELLEPGTPVVEESTIHKSTPAVFIKPALHHRNSEDSLIEDELNNSLHILSRTYPEEMNFDYDVIVSISPDRKITTVSCPPTTRISTTRHRPSRPASHPLPRISRLDAYDTDDIILDDREFLEPFTRRDTGFITKVSFTDSMDSNMDDC